MGEDYKHVHHYCWAMMSVSRGNRTANSKSSAAHYKNAIDDFDYVIRAASNSFALKPEIHLKKGMTLRLLRNDAAAAKEFLTAIKLKPDYTPAYAALVDLYIDLGNRNEALKILDAGLAQVPDSQILSKKKLELEGGSSE